MPQHKLPRRKFHFSPHMLPAWKFPFLPFFFFWQNKQHKYGFLIKMPKLCRHVDGNAASPSRAAPAPATCFALPNPNVNVDVLLATFAVLSYGPSHVLPLKEFHRRQERIVEERSRKGGWPLLLTLSQDARTMWRICHETDFRHCRRCLCHPMVWMGGTHPHSHPHPHLASLGKLVQFFMTQARRSKER